NLPAETFTNLDVNVVGFYDRLGRPQKIITVNPVSGKPVSLPGIDDLLVEHPSLNLPRSQQESFSGVLRLPGDQLLLVGTGPIMPSDRSAPPNGTLVMGRVLDSSAVESIGESTQLDLTMSTAPIAADVPAATTTASAIEVTQPILGVRNEPLGSLQVSRPREAWHGALQSLYYLGLVIMLFVIVTMAVIHRGIDRMVLTRLSNLDLAVSRIRHSGKPESLDVPGNDEISSLADNVDALVVELDDSRSHAEQARDELELRVRERTEELSHAVEDLTGQIERREQAEQARELSQRRYESLIENLSDVVFTMRPDGTLDFVSSAVQSMFEVRAEDLVGKSLAALLGTQAAEQVQRRLKRGLSDEGAHLTIDGCSSERGPVDIDVILSTNPAGRGTQGILRDVTARRRHENELLHMASHDFLTGLWNRRRFEDELARELNKLGNGGQQGAVLWLDLDGFKDVNDTLGHKAGDELLGMVSRTLTESVRADSVVARLGGDEFAILLPSCDQDSAYTTAERLAAAISDIRVDLDGRLFRASASFGIVRYPEDGAEVEELLARADMAMYGAKELGRSHIVIFNHADEWKSVIEDRRVWTEMVELALAEDGLVAYAQPIHDLGNGDLVSYELLVRMLDFEGSLILPDRFLPVAERSGMIVDIDIWILRQAVGILVANPNDAFRLNVNASPRTLADPRYLDELGHLVGTSGIDPSRLTIEITETAIIVDVASVSDTLRRIKKLGCRIALDDFGSGFTSFLHLKQLPVDDIKIDGSFVRNVSENLNDQHLVRAMVEMAKGLNMQTTAEFVETVSSMDLLRTFGVEMVQGFAIGRPGPAETTVIGTGIGEGHTRRPA
ncbi:MAG TPA: EAL domain-containing protein, partial [Coriobacteriia bacterium]|nr:EAL domain-containing protein [Coriobacteriia bacterium]